MTRTPRLRAPAAIAIVTSTGFARPSSGDQMAESMPLVSISGNSALTSVGETSCLSCPMSRMKFISRRCASRRALVVAICRWPH